MWTTRQERSPFQPQGACRNGRIHPHLRQPPGFIAIATHLAMMSSTQGDCELIADLTAGNNIFRPLAASGAHLRDFSPVLFRSRTPGPPPFSSMKSTPAPSKARLITSSVARRGWLAPDSIWCTVTIPRPASFARSCWLHGTSPGWFY
jgi:hypothetical protein